MTYFPALPLLATNLATPLSDTLQNSLIFCTIIQAVNVMAYVDPYDMDAKGPDYNLRWLGACLNSGGVCFSMFVTCSLLLQYFCNGRRSSVLSAVSD